MATDINIPGEELREAERMLGLVHDLVDIDRSMFDFDVALGRDLSRGAARHFEKKWDDGKKQLKRQVKGVREAIDNILESFERTDLDAVSNLDDGKSGQ